MEGSAKEGQPKYWILEDVLLHLNVRELPGTQTDRQTDTCSNIIMRCNVLNNNYSCLTPVNDYKIQSQYITSFNGLILKVKKFKWILNTNRYFGNCEWRL